MKLMTSKNVLLWGIIMYSKFKESITAYTGYILTPYTHEPVAGTELNK